MSSIDRFAETRRLLALERENGREHEQASELAFRILRGIFDRYPKSDFKPTLNGDSFETPRFRTPEGVLMGLHTYEGHIFNVSIFDEEDGTSNGYAQVRKKLRRLFIGIQ